MLSFNYPYRSLQWQSPPPPYNTNQPGTLNLTYYCMYIDNDVLESSSKQIQEQIKDLQNVSVFFSSGHCDKISVLYHVTVCLHFVCDVPVCVLPVTGRQRTLLANIRINHKH